MDKVNVRSDVLRLKSLISEPRNLRVRDEQDEFLTQLKDMGYRIEELEKKLEDNQSAASMKRKKQVILILKAGRKTALEVGKVLKMSRTRASEYLNSLEKEKIIVSERVDRKKYYRLGGGLQ
jgi:DNA-binding transcriptional ArsR family regulator